MSHRERSEMRVGSAPKILDLFCGIGGLSYGFSKMGFHVIGMDLEKRAGLTFSLNRVGDFVLIDLTRSRIGGSYDVVIGGPPCEPWSALNLTRRGKMHPKHKCLLSFFEVIGDHEPPVFIMENVPAIKSDPSFKAALKETKENYDTCIKTVSYSEYGSAFSRHRVFVTGIKQEYGLDASRLVEYLRKEPPSTVEDRIDYLRDKERDEDIDHVWPNVKTIHKYRKYYESGKYGWYILEWDKPSPSFGNVTKTYILHPDSFNNGMDARPISVREALDIVGFPKGFVFPSGIPLGAKYEMISDAVSPVFSLKLAHAVKKLLRDIQRAKIDVLERCR